MPDQTVAQSLAATAAALSTRPRSDATSAAVTRTLLDWFGVAIAGAAQGPSTALAATLATGGPSRLLAGGSADPATAALINGTAAHTLELDDIYGPGLVHPGAPVVAAALAVSDLTDAPGRDLEQAVIAGVEVCSRVAQDLGPVHYQRWHTTGTAGTLGAATAAAHLLRLSPGQTTHAIALAATMTGGLQQTFRKDAAGKPLHAGHAAQAGVVAAIVASEGTTGALDALEGDSGLAAATASPTPWTLSRGTNADSPLIEQLTVKPFPCCGHTFAAIEAALELHRGGAVPDDPHDIATITVSTYRTALDVTGNPDPQTVPGTRFSLAYTVAVALLDGTLGQSSFTASRIADPRRRALSDRVRVEVRPEFEAAFPSRRGAAVTIGTRHGGQESRAVPDRPGSPQNPLSPEAIAAKFRGLVEPGLSPANADRLRDQIRNLSHLASVRELTGYGRPPVIGPACDTRDPGGPARATAAGAR